MRAFLVAFTLCLASPALAQADRPLPPVAATAMTPELFLGARKTEQRGGKGTLTIVPAKHAAFSRALHIRTDVHVVGSWGVETRMTLAAPMKAGQAGLVRFWARCTETADETGVGLIRLAIARTDGDRAKSLELEAGANAGWQQFSFPFVAGGELPLGNAEVIFMTGNRAQTIEIGGVEVLTFADGVSADALPKTEFTYEGREAGAAWRKDAEARILALRRAALTVSVVGSDGRPVPDATVQVRMKRHAFQFGSSVAMKMITGTDADSERYRAKILELYNAVSTENETKWPGWEGDWDWVTGRDKTLEGLRWLKRNDLYVRGHVLVWPGWKNLPAGIKGLRDTPQQDTIPGRVTAHIADITATTAGLIDEWDVLNEPYLNNDLMKLFGRGIMADWFKEARRVLPHAPLYLNEAAGHDYVNRPVFVQSAIETVKELRAAGADVDGVGIQSHMSNLPSPPARILKTFDLYAKLGVKIRATEFDMDTADEKLQADFTRDYLIVLYSHPNVVGYQSWGFWAKQHWRPRGAFFREDWSERPALAEYRKLVFGKWWTNTEGMTGARGTYATPAFQGRYEIAVAKGGKRVVRTVDIPLGLTAAGVMVVLP
ncbi:endo-1,4-beta-xylanase [Sandaracinobacteroides saxicola]|uniref:endo-1,4-beta-xylanase n=1 Tax=Sandaracinobacteroides saxicola TaxID=2759707 RepID=A0A7G5IM55_9SPHN|nr:endo-1,4-beta-xylanase [Sandaracinobacteroides saxicola]QMW24447.1 endo-1,4-beta-xylanase [Sandaracinobacteroides saxicola]